MANTRQAAKRARQSETKKQRNSIAKGKTRTAVKKAVTALAKKDQDAAASYHAAVKALAKAGGQGTIPKNRAARKTARLTALFKKTMPEAAAASPATKK